MDETTIEAAKRGDRTAQGRLLTGLQDVWFRFCFSQLRDPEWARDATQETALRFLRQLGGFRGESQLRTWSLGIALNVVREMRRKKSSSAGDVLDDPIAAEQRSNDPRPEHLAEFGEAGEMLRRTLDELPDRQREAIVLRFFEELSVEQTAAAMQCAAGTVKATVHQALRTLRTKLRQGS